ncbi:restriction endonuclease subunit S [Kordiimonas sp.]|uniref:restriction endonuclease subunit S n=1 Tax=Kordiimonas sp. TaxID=1970157 RepID=UPI003A95D576
MSSSSPLPTESLEGVCELIVDCPHSTPKWTDQGFLVIRNQNIRNGRLDLSSKSYTDAEHFAHRIRRAKPQANDIIFTREAPMGEVCLVPEGLECCVGQRQVLLRVKEGVDPTYVFYALQSPAVRHQIFWNEGTGSTVSNLRIPVLKKLEIPRIGASEEKIANILYTLDARIELNQRMNKTLEEMAQAIFKCWFVDFEPTRAKMAQKEGSGESEASICNRLKITPDILALFPNKLVDSELGPIPDGWRVRPFSDYATLVTTGVKPFEDPNKDWVHYSIPAYDANHLPIIDAGSNIKSSKYAISQPTVLVSKLNPTTKRTWVICEPKPCSICSTEFMQFVPNQKLSGIGFLYGMIESPNFQAGMLETVTGSTGSRQRAKPPAVHKMQLVFPTTSLIEVYEKLISSLVSQLESNRWEAHSLAQTRDVLLPKLLSGEISVGQAQDEVEGV